MTNQFQFIRRFKSIVRFFFTDNFSISPFTKWPPNADMLFCNKTKQNYIYTQKSCQPFRSNFCENCEIFAERCSGDLIASSSHSFEPFILYAHTYLSIYLLTILSHISRNDSLQLRDTIQKFHNCSQSDRQIFAINWIHTLFSTTKLNTLQMK